MGATVTYKVDANTFQAMKILLAIQGEEITVDDGKTALKVLGYPMTTSIPTFAQYILGLF